MASLHWLRNRSHGIGTPQPKENDRNDQKQRLRITYPLIMAFFAVPWFLFIEFSASSLERSLSWTVEHEQLDGLNVSTARTYYVPTEDEDWRTEGYAVVIQEYENRHYTRVSNVSQAHYIWREHEDKELYQNLQPWQRYNWIPGSELWDDKALFVQGMNAYTKKHSITLPWLPRTFRLYDTEDRNAFLKHLKHDTGKNQPWVLKISTKNNAEGIFVIGPNSPELDEIESSLSKGEQKYIKTRKGKFKGYIMQEYLCDGLTFEGRKFDLRVYWMVLSIEPLIVLYTDGIMRIAGHKYQESNFSDASSHVTTSHGTTDGSWDECSRLIRQHYKANKELKQLLPHGIDPVDHVRNQMKAAIVTTVQAFRETSFVKGVLSADNGFANLGADFFINRDLSVYMIEPQTNPSYSIDSVARRKTIQDTMLPSMVRMLEEIEEKQARGLPLLPIANMGNEFELIYADDFQFTYDFEWPKEKKGCRAE
jgi:hypothetical protein